MEEWRPVKLKGYTKLYEVSNTGKVRSIARAVKRSRVHGFTHTVETHIAHFKSREIKPYKPTSRGVKYHLHRRIYLYPGYTGQTDIYVYAEDLVKGAFPELYKGVK